MHAIIIHGMGRTPLSMCFLATRLRAAGIKISLFAYTATFEDWGVCTKKLCAFIDKRVGEEDFIVIAHSLGTVLTRAVLPTTCRKPAACFFLAPPTQACIAACRLAPRWWYRLLAGEMGQLLANQEFMSTLPIPEVPTKIYAGNAGLTGRYSPFKEEPNDGVLMVKETFLPDIPFQVVPSLHTFIMNNRMIAKDIIEITKKLKT
ncbi:hypothetical protein [Methyloglobulus sp.]|uniref:esterase/lipase family protein n=1 Tax=Methyloglobulus sp. TaxID=2518622 RepID=UPI0032B82E12